MVRVQAVLAQRFFLSLLAHVNTPAPRFQKPPSHLICKSIILVPVTHKYSNSVLSTVYQPEKHHFKTSHFIYTVKNINSINTLSFS